MISAKGFVQPDGPPCRLTRVEREDGYFQEDLEYEPNTVVLDVARKLVQHFELLTRSRQDEETYLPMREVGDSMIR